VDDDGEFEKEIRRFIQERACAQNRCGEAPEVGDAVGHDRAGHYTINALADAGIITPDDVRRMSNAQLLDIRRIGVDSLARLRKAFPRD
jgi:hypothetical protein